MGSPSGPGIKNLLQCRSRRRCKIDPWVGKIPWRRTRQCFCLENPMDRGTWQAIVQRVTKSWTWLNQLSMHAGMIRDRDEEIHKVRAGRVKSARTSVFVEWGCVTLLVCGCVLQPGSFPNPILLGFLWKLPYISMSDKWASDVTQSCLTLWDPMDCSLPRSSIHGIFQARVLEWVLFPSPEDLPNPRIEPRSSAL